MLTELTDKEIISFLDKKHLEFNTPSYITSDPIQVPHLFSGKENIEIAAYLTATLAWGRRQNIIANAKRLMALMDNAPHQFVTQAQHSDLAMLKNFVHRTFNGYDCMFFVRALGNIYNNHGGLHAVFKERYVQTGDIKHAIAHHRTLMLETPLLDARDKHLANIHRNSSCKRVNMFLRWMVRNDGRGVDFGLWNDIPASSLYIPLDVHAGNVARKLGILQKKHNDWKAVEQLTSRLRFFCPSDPVKYDYSLFGLGVFDNF